MLLSDIIPAVQPLEVLGAQNIEITSTTNNSAAVKPNSLFICIAGYRYDGHSFAKEAVKKGAVAIITEKKLAIKVPQLIVENSRKAQALASHLFYNYPTSKIRLVGITGTNGKTTTAFLTNAILQAAGYPTGLISTVCYKTGQQVMPAKTTTPDALELGQLFHQMVSNKQTAATMEVSSHALELHRVTGCDFHTTVFTNITRDHFEFHLDFHNYLRAKTRLFSNQCLWSNRPPDQLNAVINADDPNSPFILQGTTAKNIYTYGLSQSAQVRLTGYQLASKASIFQVSLAGKNYSFNLPIPGLFNIYNTLAAITVGLIFAVPPDIIRQAVTSFSGVPGRCEFINCGQSFNVMVDFAHNPSGLYHVLATIPYPNRNRRKIVVFGCEGGKDPGKRSLMGAIAAKHADYCIVTTDNIYREEPLDIAQDIEQGLLWGGMKPSRYKIILDRYQAISHALDLAKPGDTVIIAGKGHETSQVIYDQVIPFDDRLVVKDLLRGKTGLKS